MRVFYRFLFGVGLLLVLTVGTALVLSWAPDRSVEELSARWAPPPSEFVRIGGMRVHLRDEGPRKGTTPIVLLHGTSASLHTWDGWAAGLSEQRRVIRLDLPGFGLTGPTPDGVYRIERYVETVVALLDRLGVRRAIIAGNSFGGQVAWQTALAHPRRVAALVLVDAAGYPLKPEDVPIGFRIARTPWLAPLMRVTLPRGMIDASVRNVYGDPGKVTPELVDRYYELTLRAGNREALRQRFAQAQAGPGSERIRELTVPTLILWGGQDRLIPPADGERFHQDIAGSELVMFDELGHVPHEEDPARTLAAVQAFLQPLGESR
ncbi:alpha/beta fold hydrolase [Sinimarinibacterium flocculans]|uniref:Pimeloyl-ACP methyl ester carboxylesterase n=1 Tax=Sinimarinibacterium flocculans TaxID=985250 RepID=A0A318E3I4_9GAMM|nr:alpha/beta fold hydrolase [Sinimarinibacterium flocculans]PXV64237.1 pimeloyl-ACP methyl ester carboxylesterase [Sinimarinibacterium flocculans]